MKEVIAEVRILREEVERLRAEVADVREALKFESWSTTQHFGDVFRELRRIEERLDPVLLKVFPLDETLRRQIDACTKTSPTD